MREADNETSRVRDSSLDRAPPTSSLILTFSIVDKSIFHAIVQQLELQSRVRDSLDRAPSTSSLLLTFEYC